MDQNLATRSYFGVSPVSSEYCLVNDYKPMLCRRLKQIMDELGYGFSCWLADLEGDGEAARYQQGTSSTLMNEKTYPRDGHLLAACTDI